MFGKFRVLAKTHDYIEHRPPCEVERRPSDPAPVGSAFEQADGSIAVYLDALPVSGRLLLVPMDDARAKPVRRGAL